MRKPQTLNVRRINCDRGLEDTQGNWQEDEGRIGQIMLCILLTNHAESRRFWSEFLRDDLIKVVWVF